MEADVLTAFLGNSEQKIKVFPARKNVRPFHVEGRALRRVFPFLLASAMVFTGCKEQKTSISENTPAPQTEILTSQSTSSTQAAPSLRLQTQSYWDNIYQRTIEKYHLTALKDKEPLSLEDVKKLLTERPNIAECDSNFNHAPASVENFWEIIKSGIAVAQDMQSSPNLTAQQKQQYIDKSVEALSKISKVKGSKGEVDLDDYNNMHAFLFFEKVSKYKGDTDYVFHETAGWIDEKDELFGRYYKDHQAFEAAAQQYPGIEIFTKALYSNNERFILSAEDSVYANALSRKMFTEWRREQHIEKEHLCSFTDIQNTKGVTGIFYRNERRYVVGISFTIDPQGQTHIGKFSPVGLTEIHEAQHMMQFKPNSGETPQDNLLKSEHTKPQNVQQNENSNLLELGPTLYTLTMSDRIYKAIHKIDRNQEVDYGVNIQIGNASIGIGKIANWFGEMLEKYPSPSVDYVLQQKEVLQQINQWGLGHQSSQMMLNGTANSINSSL